MRHIDVNVHYRRLFLITLFIFTYFQSDNYTLSEGKIHSYFLCLRIKQTIEAIAINTPNVVDIPSGSPKPILSNKI